MVSVKRKNKTLTINQLEEGKFYSLCVDEDCIYFINTIKDGYVYATRFRDNEILNREIPTTELSKFSEVDLVDFTLEVEL